MNTSSHSTHANSNGLPNPSGPDIESAPPNSSPASGDAEDKPKYRHGRTGKVARLSKDARDQVNEMLSDGLPYADIIANLGEAGAGLDEGHIGTWKNGGYQDWLREQTLLEQCRRRQELTLDFARENTGVDALQASQNIVIGLLTQALAECGEEAIRDSFQKNPLNILRAVGALSRLTSGGLKLHRHQAEVAQQSANTQRNAADPKKGISPDVLQQMINQLNLM
jgi:hypothetical protein